MRKFATLMFLLSMLTIVVSLVFAEWIMIRSIGRCAGGVYQNHPGLVSECLHQQSVNHSDPYPAPGTPEPYPAPTPQIILTSPLLCTTVDSTQICYP